MSEAWKRWEGQVVGDHYRLQKFLGSTDHSAVYQAGTADPARPVVAVKLVPAALPGAAGQLALWERAAELEHPNLLKLFASGRCRLGEQEHCYAVLEYAEENLGQVLPLRPLTVEETRQILEVVLPVLGFLHQRGLVHGHVKPANILAQGELLKLSSDTIGPSGEKRRLGRTITPYDAPETLAGPIGTASDVWSLGVTLLEACTQRPVEMSPVDLRDPDIPAGLQEPFAEIVRHALRTEPAKRWKCEQIAERLNPGSSQSVASSVGSARGQAGPSAPGQPERQPDSPLSVPLSPEPALPLKKLPKAEEAVRTDRRTPAAISARRNYAVPLVVVVLAALVVLLLVPKFSRRTSPPVALTTPSSQTPLTSAGKSEAGPPSQPHEPSRTAAAPAPPAPARTAPAKPARQVLAEASGHGDVLESVLPQASPKALGTITGTVHVVVRAQVDATGKVSEATLETAGPSNYFARLSLEAARQWQFASPVQEGRSLPSEWLLRFEFSSSGVQAFPAEVTP